MPTDMRLFVQRYLGSPSKAGPKWWSWHCQNNRPDEDPSLKVEVEGFKCFSCGAYAQRGRSDIAPEVLFLRTELGYAWVAAWADVAAEEFPGRSRREHAPTVTIGPLPPHSRWRETFSGLLRGCQQALWFDRRCLGRKFVDRRRLRLTTCEHFGVGYHRQWTQVQEYDTWLAEGLVFPALVNGQLWSLEVRVTSESGPKYHRPKGGSEPTPFGIGQLQGCGVLVITEGAIDAMVAWQICEGSVDVLGLRGAANQLRAWESYLGYRRVVVATDADQAGDDVADRLLGWYPSWERRRPPDGMDLCDMLKVNQLTRGWLVGEVTL